MHAKVVIGPRVRKSPFFDDTIAAGADQFTIYNHMYMPSGFGDPLGDYWQLINSVAMWDVSCERQVQLSGPDAGQLADYLSTRDLLNCEIGIGKYAPMTNYLGYLINDPVAQRIEEDVYWLSIADNDQLFAAQAVAAERGLRVEVSEPDVSPLAIQGPKSFDVAATLLGDWVRDLRYFHFRASEIEGIPLIVARSGWSKQGGFELYLRDGKRGHDLWQLVKEAGAPYGIKAGNPNAIERIESGLVNFGSDNDDCTDPFEMGLDAFIDLDNDRDFIGKKPLLEIAKRGPKRGRVGLFLDGAPLAGNEQKYPIEQNGKVVGLLNAHTFSPRLERNIAIALLNREIPDDGLSAALPDGRRNVQVTTLPFI